MWPKVCVPASQMFQLYFLLYENKFFGLHLVLQKLLMSSFLNLFIDWMINQWIHIVFDTLIYNENNVTFSTKSW